MFLLVLMKEVTGEIVILCTVRTVILVVKVVQAQ